MSDALPAVAIEAPEEPPILPHGPIDLAPKTAREKLAEDLSARGLRLEAARAVARAVPSPRAVRAQLRSPIRRRVAGGVLEVIFAPVYLAAVIPSPLNPRTVANCSFPAAGVLQRRTPLPPPTLAPDGGAELCLTVPDEATLVGSLEQAAADLLEAGSLEDDIAIDGIRESVLLVALTISHVASGTQLATLASADGSTRIASGHQVHGLKPVDVLYRYPHADDRRLRGWVNDHRRLSEQKSLAQLTNDERARLRTALVPAEIIVGWTPDTGDDVSFVHGLDSRLGQIHGDPPTQWSEAAKRDLRLTAALDALQEDGAISSPMAKYIAGFLAPDEAVQEGCSSELDARAMESFHALIPRNVQMAAALRQLAARSTKISPNVRQQLAAEAALRPLRVSMNNQRQGEARSTLEATFGYLADRHDTMAPVDHATTPDELRDRALAELSQENGPGPAALDLLGRGMFWLAVHGAASSTTGGQHRDRRAFKEVLDRLARSPHAMHVFHQALVDGRNGQRPHRVEADGSPWVGPSGPEEVSEQWLREQVVPKDAQPADDAEAEAEMDPTPEEYLRNAEIDLLDRSAGLEDAFDALRTPVGPGGLSLVETQGVADHIAGPVLDRLRAVQEGLVELRTIGRQNAGRVQGAVPVPAEDS